MIRAAVTSVRFTGQNRDRIHNQIGHVALAAVCEVHTVLAKKLSSRYKPKYYGEPSAMLPEERLDVVSWPELTSYGPTPRLNERFMRIMRLRLRAYSHLKTGC